MLACMSAQCFAASASQLLCTALYSSVQVCLDQCCPVVSGSLAMTAIRGSAAQGFHILVDDLGPFGEVARTVLAGVAEEHGRVPRLLFALRDSGGRPRPLQDVSS